MKENELVDLLKELSESGLGPMPGVTGKSIDAIIIDEISGDGLMRELEKNFEKKREEEVKDPVQEAMKKDPLFGSW